MLLTTESSNYHGSRSTMRRVVASADAVPVIVKQIADDEIGIFRLRNEWRILTRLQGVAGCPRQIEFIPAANELIIEDFGGVLLSQSGLLGNANVETIFDIAENLATIVAALHVRGVIHKDITPDNILVRPEDWQLQIIDFGLATTFAEERPEFEHPSHLSSALAYMSPEQTGRMNRPVDYRTDLYSLGVMLYELSTGMLPFAGEDALELIHAHLARSPRPPREVAPWLPLGASELILLLLAKEPDDRYQSASGVVHDLRLLRERCAKSIHDVPRLREHDIPLTLRPPRRLYGRSKELAMLLNAFAEAAAGAAQSLFVAGYSGVGKTSLVHEIYRPVTMKNGLFVSGKFEQFNKERPLLAPVQCLNQLCQLLLAEPEDTLSDWRARALAGIGSDAGAIFEVLPEMEELLGPQPAVQALGPLEAQTRLRNLLVTLICLIASPKHPLVMFLDDLQWSDQPSLDLIDTLLTEPNLSGFFLIGAYRDNEVDTAHPLLRLLRQPTSQGKLPQILQLSSLTMPDLDELLADMLHMTVDEVHSLAVSLFAKTSGNPYFTVEFLNALYREGALWPDSDTGQWSWDSSAIFAHPSSDNVVDFLTAQLTSFTASTAETLVAAACLGNEFELDLLALAAGLEPGTLVELLQPALERGIIITPSALALYRPKAFALLRFCHDRMQQAVYQLRDEPWRRSMHLNIARRLLRTGDDSYKVMAAEHYAAAAMLLDDAAESAYVRDLFLKAAVQARQAGAFVAAEKFLRLAVNLLPLDFWQTCPIEAFRLHVELHLVLFSQSQSREADEVFELLSVHAENPLRLVEPTCLQIVSLSNRIRSLDAVNLGSSLLARLGIQVPQSDLSERVEQEFGLFYQYVADGVMERLPEGSALEDELSLSAAHLLNAMGPAAFFCKMELSSWTQLRLVRLWIEQGFCHSVLFPAGYLTMSTISVKNDYRTGYRLSATALATGLAREHGVETARTQHVFGLFNSHWFEPLENDIEHARVAFTGLLRAGELEMSCYTYLTVLSALLDLCAELPEMREEIATAIKFSIKAGNRNAEQSFLSYRQLVRALEGRTAAPGRFDDAAFNEQAHLEAAEGSPMALCIFRIYHAFAACLFCDDKELVRHADALAGLTVYIPGFYATGLANVLQSLALLVQFRDAASADRPALLQQIHCNQQWLAARAADAPMNFRHLYELVEADRFDALDQPWEAIQAFQQAMRLAQAHRRPGHLALITERAGLFSLRRELEFSGHGLLVRAHELYLTWGAVGKAEAMRKQFPFLDAGSHGREFVEYEAMTRASQALASETSLPFLVARVVELMGQLGGASDVSFLLQDEDGIWQLEGGLCGSKTLPRMTLSDAQASLRVSAVAFRLAQKTMNPLLSDDAVIDSRFVGDPYFRGLLQCSLLVLPVSVRGRISALLMLENRLFRAAFTAKRVDTLSLLCGQLAISLENVRVYQSLEKKVAERTRDLEIANRKLEKLSATDGLTGIANRRRFDEVLLLEWRRAKRSQQSLSLAMFDLDWFKKYNDFYGHQAGDECLRVLAEILKKHACRAGDLGARYGGEEFALIAAETDAAALLNIAESVRKSLESLHIPHAESPDGQVTVSIGIATMLAKDGLQPEMLLHQADEALYRAKAKGRNRTETAADSG